MIKLVDLRFTHNGQSRAVFEGLNLEYQAGEFALICGATGSGKSTLLMSLVGLAPHTTGGTLAGQIRFGQGELARDYTGLRPADYSSMVGYVNQTPGEAFVAQTVAEELAFGLEQAAVPSAEMLVRVAEVAALLGIEDLLIRDLNTLSGGQKQRVAIAASMAAGQRILLLDEPTSELDFSAAEALLGLLRNLATNHGYTVLLVEHRLELALSLVDSVTVLNGFDGAEKYSANELPVTAFNQPVAAPMVELARKLGWRKVPRSVAAAQTLWRDRASRVRQLELPASSASPVLVLNGVNATVGKEAVLTNLNLTLYPSEIAALIGPNGAGKSTLLNLIWDRHSSECVLVPQHSDSLLMAQTVVQELSNSDERAGVASGTTEKLFAALVPEARTSGHPYDLSAGQRVALALAMQLVRGNSIVLLDEPTRGLDYSAKADLAALLIKLSQSGKSVLVASHDSEFLATCADRVHSLNNGQIGSWKSPTQALGRLGDHTPQLLQVTGAALRLQQLEAAE